MVKRALLCRRRQRHLDRRVRFGSKHSPPPEIANRGSIAEIYRGARRRMPPQQAILDRRRLSRTRGAHLSTGALYLAIDSRFHARAPMYQYISRESVSVAT